MLLTDAGRMVKKLEINEKVLSREELTGIALRSLYYRHGYRQYRMSKFEEYDLYAHNKDFLVSDNIITFTDLNGRLLALKPDVTLSIVRSGRDEPGAVQKVYYNENVYRAGAGRSFKEIMQVGVECIGDINEGNISEVLQLAAESLQSISSESILSISNLDIVSDLLDDLNVAGEDRADILRSIGEKNPHGLARAAAAAGVGEDGIKKLSALATTYGRPEEVLETVRGIVSDPSEMDPLVKAVEKLEELGYGGMLRIDFSVTGDLRYYNGIVFRGYVSGVAESVITGGSYDRLMKKMGRSSRAIGFAVYLSALEQLVPLTDADRGGEENA